MEINVCPVDNGWLVSTNNGKTKRVFIDREAMMEHINDIVPATGEECNFISNLDDEDEDDEDYNDLGKMKIEELFNQLQTIKKRRLNCSNEILYETRR